MHYVEAKTVLTPQNGYSPYHGSTEKSIYCEGLRKPYSKGFDDYFDVEIKKNAPDLLAKALARKRTRGMVIVGNIVDPYMSLEKDEKIMRESLMVIGRYDFGVSVTTRNTLILRDIDICEDINRNSKVVVNIPIETLSDDISEKICVGASPVSERFRMIETLLDKGITVVVLIQPLIPFINDRENDIEKLLDKLSKYNISGIDPGNMLLTLRAGVGQNFHQMYSEIFPEEYKEFYSSYGKSEVIAVRENEKLYKMMASFANEKGIIFGKSDVDKLNRSYENKTEGRQLSFFS